MNDIKILIVEDDFSFVVKLEMMLESLSYTNIHKVESGEEALKSIDAEAPTLILMDINLKGDLTGINVGEKIQNRNIPIIYLTAYTDSKYFEKAKETKAYAYLNKPFDEIILKRSIELALAHVSKISHLSETGAIFIRHAGKLEKINFKDILWVKAEGNYCYIFTGKKKYVTKISLVRLMEKLPHDMFIRSHRNILIQADEITQVDLVGNKIHIRGNNLPIGSTYRKAILERFRSDL